MQVKMDHLQQRLREAENRPSGSSAEDRRKEVRFDELSPYPLKFIQELTKVKERYYDNSNIQWIGQHLECEADIWWHITRSQVSSYEDFIKVFIAKYWNNERQELVRDDMEYGKYRPSEHGGATLRIQESLIVPTFWKAWNSRCHDPKFSFDRI